MADIPIYNSNPGSPLGRCTAVNTETRSNLRCTKYNEHTTAEREYDRQHLDSTGYAWPGPQARESQDEALRELVSWGRSMSDQSTSGLVCAAYDNMADRLAAILDGES